MRGLIREVCGDEPWGRLDWAERVGVVLFAIALAYDVGALILCAYMVAHLSGGA